MQNTENGEFKKGDYIVIDTDEGKLDCIDQFTHEMCYKQRVDDIHIHPELDNRGSVTNAWYLMKFNNTVEMLQNKIRWRYATEEEAELYEFYGKPYKVKSFALYNIDAIDEYLDILEEKFKP